jgi:hypothetical protein
VSRPVVYFAIGKLDRLLLEALKGKPVLESFAYQQRTFDRYRPTWSRAFLDSGAFTEMNSGTAIDLDAYIAFCLEHGAFYERIANLDDIRGDIDKSRRNHARMLDAGIKAMPVFHQGEPWSVLDEVCAAAPEKWIGLGFQRPIQGGDAWLADVFSRLPNWISVHGFAMTAYMQFPFASVDSSTWVYDWRGLMSVDGQGSDALRLLTPGELMDIVVKKYERMEPKRKWNGSSQSNLFEAIARAK